MLGEVKGLRGEDLDTTNLAHHLNNIMGSVDIFLRTPWMENWESRGGGR